MLVVGRRDIVFVQASIAVGAMALEVRLTYWTIKTQAKAIFVSEELVEFEAILWLLAFYGSRPEWYGAHNLSHGGAL
jgi:hypothetical protein